MDRQSAHDLLDKIRKTVAEVIIGYDEVTELILASVLTGGHILIEDVPGVGKTMLARTLAIAMGLDFKRIQFTPDLLPSDITGINVYNPRDGEFNFVPGPVFTNILLADEINRATPRTQSALLECMQERQVTTGGITRPLDSPFITLATQNPVEMSGTFPLPGAQMDRFLMRVHLGYPSGDDEMEIVNRYPRMMHPEEMISPVTNKSEMEELRALASEVHLSDDLREYIVAIVRRTRQRPEVQLGASPRSAIMLAAAARSLAFTRNREYVTPDDVQDLGAPVLAHRLVASEDSWLRGREGEAILEEVLREIPVPGEDL